MAEITNEFIKQCYQLGKLVHQDQMDMLDATEKMSEIGMTDTSAFMYLTALQCMLSGKVFKRTISYKAAEYFLRKISEDFDQTVLDKALQSLEQYIAYINQNGSSNRKLQEQALIKQYRNEPQEEDNTELKNLNELGNAAAEKYKSTYVWREIKLSDSLKNKIKEHLELHNKSCVMAEYTGRVVTTGNNTTDFSYQVLEVASYFVEFYNEGKKYDDFAKEVLDYTKQRVSPEFARDRKFGTKLFSCLRESEADWKQKVSEQFSPDVAVILDEGIASILPDDGSKDLFITCITNKGWSHSSKTIERSNYDYISSAVKSLANVVAVNHGFISPILEMFSDDKDIFYSFNQEIKSVERPNSADEHVMAVPGYNLIVYGAPGSGKSYYINTKSAKERAIRTVFHPEYQHSDFSGCLKPSRDENGDISYSFVPGPFIKSLLRAAADPENEYTLIIEEINRANAPAVFGDIFQLLDRKPNGQSEYTITPDESLCKFLEENGYATPDSLSIPSNLKILATMNSADQGVFMMDSAFKRRWKFKYRPIVFDDGEASFDDQCIPYKGEKYCWKDFATTINDYLKELSIEEDRLLGPYFLSGKEREDEASSKDAVSGKLLIYLWDDVLRHGLREKIFLKKFKTFAELVTAYKNNTKDQGIFAQDLEVALQKKLETRKLLNRNIEEEPEQDEAEEAA